MVQFKQGESQMINIPIQENGKPVVLNNILGIRCVLKVRRSHGFIDVGKYSLNPAQGYGILTIDPNLVSVNVEVSPDQSRNFVPGVLSASITATFVDNEFSSGERTDKYDQIIGRVLPGNDLNEIP